MEDTVTKKRDLCEPRKRPVLEVRGLTTRLRRGRESVTVVNDISFTLFPGQTVAIVGESGSGKSMAALSLLRILPTPPALLPQGAVLYRGHNLLTLSEKKIRRLRGSKLAMIFQDPMSALNPVYTIGDQLIEVAHLHLHLHGELARKKVLEALAEVGIPAPQERLRVYPHQLSGGMKQRVMIAMALMASPDVLIADEPTTALDVTVQAQVLDLIRNLQRKKQMALLLITHDMGVVAEMADEVLVMYASQVVERGPVRAIFDRPTHPYTKALFAARPRLGCAELEAVPGAVPALGSFPKGCPFHPRCTQAMALCKEGSVPTVNFSADHQTRCHLYHE